MCWDEGHTRLGGEGGCLGETHAFPHQVNSSISWPLQFMSPHLTLGTLHKPELLLGLLGEEKWGYWYLGQPWEEELVFQWIECEENRGEYSFSTPKSFTKNPQYCMEIPL